MDLGSALDTSSLGSVDISSVLNSKGSTVTCVILHSTEKKTDSSLTVDAIKSEVDSTSSNSAAEKRTEESVRTEGDDGKTTEVKFSNEFEALVSQISIDTTPRERNVEKILGGPPTFLGQYEDFGIIAMTRRQNDSDDVKLLTINPHKLQPPLHKLCVKGDILLMKVRPDEGNEDEEDTNQNEDNFFINFTKAEYLEFSRRTDILSTSDDDEEKEANEQNEDLAEKNEQNSAVDEEEDERDEKILADEDYDDDSNNDEYDPNDDEDGLDEDIDDEEEKVGMMNILMGQLLRQFRENNGRGPDRKELLQIRHALAMKLGVDVPPVSDDEGSDDQKEEIEEKVNSKDENNDYELVESTKVSGLKRSFDNIQTEDKKEDSTDIDISSQKRKVRWSMHEEDEQSAH